MTKHAKSKQTKDQWEIELKERRKAIWEIAQNRGCDAVLIFGSPGHSQPFRYLTNFAPEMGDMFALMTGEDEIACVLNFDWRLIEARRISGIENWQGNLQAMPLIVDILLNTPRIKSLGIVGTNRMPATDYYYMTAVLPELVTTDISLPINRLRHKKSDFEIDLLKRACKITDDVFAKIRAELKPGMTEHQIAARIAFLMNHQGANLSFDPVVISGNNDPIMIRGTTNRGIEVGDSIMIDIGAEWEGYQADATRTFILGEANPKQEVVWSMVKDALDAAVLHLKPGIPMNKTHYAASKIIKSAGYELIHRVGHGIGLATSFEYPSLIDETKTFEAGMTVCLEPGIYTKGAGNMKLEECYVITKKGYEQLTHADTELIIPV